MRFFLFIGMCSILSLTAEAQDYSLTNPDHYVERIPTSPEVAGLGTYGGLPVDKHTGTANISMPIHDISFEGMSIPINLSYNTGGIRVAQEATWVGLGWNLNANAVISRKINGFDDLLNGANSGPGRKSQGYIYSPSVNIDATIPDQMLTANDSLMLGQSWSGGRIMDMEPDLFTASIFGKSYSFTLSKWDGNTAFLEGINHDNAELIIRYFVVDQRFEIVDANGFTYYFNSKELSDPYRAQGSPIYGTASIESEVTARDQVGVIAIDLSKVRNAIMSFHLDRIESPFGRELNFEYEDGLHFTYPSYSHSSTINPNEGINSEPVYKYSGNVGGAYAVDCNITLIKTKYLKRIYGDFGEVEFELENRDDLYNWEIHDEITGFVHTNALPNGGIYATKQRRLNRIIVRNRIDEQIKLADLHYSYFNSDLVSDVEPERHIRLKLDRLEIDDKEYHFDYYYENSLPAKDSPSVDFWGFYNGETNMEGSNVRRIPSFGRYITARINHNPQKSEKYIIHEGATRSSNFEYGKVGLLKTVYHPTKGRTEFEYEGNRASVQKPFSQSSATIFSNSSDYKYNYQYLERAELQKQGGSTVELNIPFTVQGSETVLGDNFEVRTNIKCNSAGQGSANCSFGNPEDIFFITNVNDPNEVYGTLNFNGLNFDGEIDSDTETGRGTLRLPNGTYIMTRNPEAGVIGLTFTETSAIIIDIPRINDDTVFKEYEVGGARIKNIADYDANGDFVSKRAYNYQEFVDGRSSGTLMNELIYHSKNGYFDYTPQGYNETQFNFTSSNLLNGPGNHVSYGQVTEQQLDSSEDPKGSKTCFYYNQRNQHVLRAVGLLPEFGWYNYNNNVGGDNIVSYGFVYYLGLTPNSNQHLNGKISKEIIYNNLGNPVNETQYEYSTHEIGIVDALKVYYSGAPQAPVDKYAIYPMYQRVALLDSTVTKQYFKENSTSPEVVSTTVSQQYDSKNNAWPSGHYWPTRTTTTNSKDEEFATEIVYPMQSGTPFMSELIAANRRAQPVEVRAYNGTTFLGEQITEYGPLGALSDKYNPKTIITKKENSSEQQRITYDLYDDFGNLLQYTLSDGTPVSYLWGYDNKLYPVAKVNNAEWVNVLQSLTGAENAEITNSATSEIRMRELLNKIRIAFPNAFVTTYTYKQGVGISSMTDPRGYTTTYEYDTSQRLKLIRDADGNILSDNAYEYKTATQN